MNFLSHYYFDRYNHSSYEVLGSILPDLLKNANKNWNIFPEKNEHIFLQQPQYEILKGWKKHLLVDKLFHNSNFFLFHQHQLKLEIKEILSDSKVKPFFLGHIAIELILDNLLINSKKIQVENLYHHLDKIDLKILSDFLHLNDLKQTDKFFRFFESFKKEKYLNSYDKPENITYALKRICMRIWDNPFTSKQEIALTEILIKYIVNISEEFIIIFDEIELQLLDD